MKTSALTEASVSRDVLPGPRRPFWGCSCGHADNWACRVRCQRCGAAAPPRSMQTQRGPLPRLGNLVSQLPSPRRLAVVARTQPLRSLTWRWPSVSCLALARHHHRSRHLKATSPWHRRLQRRRRYRVDARVCWGLGGQPDSSTAAQFAPQGIPARLPRLVSPGLGPLRGFLESASQPDA